MSRPTVRFEGDLVIPASVGEYAAFREWSLSNDFPPSGRIDYLEGTIEIDMGPEDLQRHGALKGELYRYILTQSEHSCPGQAFVDRARLAHEAVGLSCEPDVVFVSLHALTSGQVRYEETRPGRQLIIHGAATLVVEVVSDSSVQKDLNRLPVLYAKAGVQELWLADGRGNEVQFEIRYLSGTTWETAPVDERGFQFSKVLSRRIRLTRTPWLWLDTFRYKVEEL